ncbi:MAG: kinase/pyrophosphorylase, partial [Planctomycetia bacterium]|nr:kinase/pyrophosphorylase [Planctomycetia bacterium]
QAVPTFDPLGPMLSLLGDRLKTAPRNVPGLHYELQKEQFDRIDAVDYTITHDDGRGLKDLPRADVVIVGVSRASKSVTCFFLAARGVRAANVPLIPGHAVPRELLKLPTRKVVGLTMNAQRLVAIRQMRLERTGESQPYIDLKQVVEELRFASHAMAQHGWRCIDVSYKAVEEVAAEVIEVLRRGTG